MIVRTKGSLARSAALIAVAVLAVHELRYLLSFGVGAHDGAAGQGHTYLAAALPTVVGFGVAIIAAGLLRAAIRAGSSPSIAAPRARALLYAASILSVYVVQESAESILSAGETTLLAAAFGAGGWIALPLAVAFGAACAVLDGGLALLEARFAAAASRSQRLRAPRGAHPRTAPHVPALASLPLPFGLARRPPPLPA
jgi:hypothetical protein